MRNVLRPVEINIHDVDGETISEEINIESHEDLIQQMINIEKDSLETESEIDEEIIDTKAKPNPT
jgi:hypothetical protein